MMMIRKEEGGVFSLEFELLLQFPKVRAAVFLRQGGRSEGPYSSLNLAKDLGDKQEAVLENCQKVQNVLRAKSLVSAKQVHGKEGMRVSSKDANQARCCDALMTNEKGIALMALHADCQAAIFYDPVNHALAAVHAGWRGSVQNIYHETVMNMKRHFGSGPENLHVCIGPSLSPEKAEFINYKNELPVEFWDFQIRPYYFDFWEISRHQLKRCGVLSHHIQVAGLCTYSYPEDFFSYRRDKVTGRNATCALLA